MDKEKQIEEMTRDLEKCCEEKSTKSCYGNCNNCTSRFMFNLGYRKINENEVVISKEEYASLKHFEKRVRGGVCLTQKEWFDFCNEDSNRRTCLRIEEREKERKETARGILLKIKEVKTQDCGYTDWLDDTFFGDEFMKLAKQYCVEIGEVK